VRGEVAAVLAGVAGSPLLIGKSLGTVAAGVAADRALPAVWLTPLLTQPWTLGAESPTVKSLLHFSHPHRHGLVGCRTVGSNGNPDQGSVGRFSVMPESFTESPVGLDLPP
jgi:hypothetical protein